MNFKEKLRAMGIDPEERPQPGGSYAAVNVRGTIGTVAIQFAIEKGKLLYRGVIGKSLTTEDGVESARLAGINAARQILHFVKEDDFAGISHLQIVYQSTEEWNEAPRVADGASNAINEIFGERGVHTRSIWAAKTLPNNLSVAVVASFVVKGDM